MRDLQIQNNNNVPMKIATKNKKTYLLESQNRKFAPPPNCRIYILFCESQSKDSGRLAESEKKFKRFKKQFKISMATPKVPTART